MTLGCDEVRDLAPAFVLGALEPTQERDVRDHLATCPETHDEVETFGGVIPYLNDSVELVEPPASLKARVLAAVTAEAQAGTTARPATSATGPAPTLWSEQAAALEVPREGPTRVPKGEPRAVGPGRAAPTPALADAGTTGATAPVRPVATPATPESIDAMRETRSRRRSPLAWVAGIAAVLAIAALGAWNVTLQNDVRALRTYESAVAQVLDVATAPGARTAVLSSDVSRAMGGLASLGTDGSFAFALRDMPATSGGEVYEAWAVAGDRQVPLGSFTVDGSGIGGLTGKVEPPGDGVVLGLTREPGPGAATPTLPMIVSGTATAPPAS